MIEDGEGKAVGRDGSRVTPRLLVGTSPIWGALEECSIHMHGYRTHDRHMGRMRILGRERGDAKKCHEMITATLFH